MSRRRTRGPADEPSGTAHFPHLLQSPGQSSPENDTLSVPRRHYESFHNRNAESKGWDREEALAAAFQGPHRCLVNGASAAYRTLESGFLSPWCDSQDPDAKKEENDGTMRARPFNLPSTSQGPCGPDNSSMHSRCMTDKEIRYATVHSFL